MLSPSFIASYKVYRKCFGASALVAFTAARLSLQGHDTPFSAAIVSLRKQGYRISYSNAGGSFSSPISKVSSKV